MLWINKHDGRIIGEDEYRKINTCFRDRFHLVLNESTDILPEYWDISQYLFFNGIPLWKQSLVPTPESKELRRSLSRHCKYFRNKGKKSYIFPGAMATLVHPRLRRELKITSGP